MTGMLSIERCVSRMPFVDLRASKACFFPFASHRLLGPRRPVWCSSLPLLRLDILRFHFRQDPCTDGLKIHLPPLLLRFLFLLPSCSSPPSPAAEGGAIRPSLCNILSPRYSASSTSISGAYP